jgi:hypothetical protein
VTNLLSNLPHLLMAAIVIAAVATLAAVGVIPGSDALVVIAGAGGVSLGVGAAAIPTPGSAPIPVAPTPTAPAGIAAISTTPIAELGAK